LVFTEISTTFTFISGHFKIAVNTLGIYRHISHISCLDISITVISWSQAHAVVLSRSAMSIHIHSFSSSLPVATFYSEPISLSLPILLLIWSRYIKSVIIKIIVIHTSKLNFIIFKFFLNKFFSISQLRQLNFLLFYDKGWEAPLSSFFIPISFGFYFGDLVFGHEESNHLI